MNARAVEVLRVILPRMAHFARLFCDCRLLPHHLEPSYVMNVALTRPLLLQFRTLQNSLRSAFVDQWTALHNLRSTGQKICFVPCLDRWLLETSAI